jgi:hypothetical protein
MSTLDLTIVDHLTICRGRCTRECQHGQPRESAMELDPTFCEHSQVHYKPAPGYTEAQAYEGASVVCAPCLAAIGGVARGDWAEERAITEVWKGFIRVRDFVMGSATRTPHLDRSYAHWPCRWEGASNWVDQENHSGGNPDEPVPETVYCPRCKQDFLTLVNWGNHTTEPDPRAELAELLDRLEAKRDAA